MKLQISKKRMSTTILISMTDVIFLLIIFLLIASNFASQTGLPIRLPGSNSAVRQTHQIVHIVYQDNENIVILGKKISMSELEQELKREYSSPEQVVRLSADKDVSLQTIITIMDIIRGSGFEKIFVATDAVSKR